jgi:hypothetical protein
MEFIISELAAECTRFRRRRFFRDSATGPGRSTLLQDCPNLGKHAGLARILEGKDQGGIRDRAEDSLSKRRHFPDTVGLPMLFPELSLDLAPGGGVSWQQDHLQRGREPVSFETIEVYARRDLFTSLTHAIPANLSTASRFAPFRQALDLWPET